MFEILKCLIELLTYFKYFELFLVCAKKYGSTEYFTYFQAGFNFL